MGKKQVKKNDSKKPDKNSTSTRPPKIDWSVEDRGGGGGRSSKKTVKKKSAKRG